VKTGNTCPAKRKSENQSIGKLIFILIDKLANWRIGKLVNLYKGEENVVG